MATMTKQGVRDLSRLGKPDHVHDWKHDPDCHCDCTWMLYKDWPCIPCMTVCDCGAKAPALR